MSIKQPAQNILVINLHSPQNAGDAALLDMALRSLRLVFPHAQIALAMNEPDIIYGAQNADVVKVVPSFAAYFRSHQENRQANWRIGTMLWGTTTSLFIALLYRVQGRSPRWLPSGLRDLLLAYMNADLVVSCPGNIFATMGRFGVPFLVSALTVTYGLLLRKSLYVMPQSIGPLKRKWERWLVRLLYSRARLVLIREPVSLRLAYEIGLTGARIRLVPDLAFALPPDSREDAERTLERLGGDSREPKIGVTVINRLIRGVSEEEWDRYETAMARALSDFLSRHGGIALFFPQVIGPTPKEDDRIAARRIVARMTNPQQAIVVNEPMPPTLLKALYSLTDLFIATRMHSAIFAASMSVPTLLIEYLHKMRGLAEMLQLEDWSIELTQVNDISLGHKLEALWKQRLPVRQHLESIVPPLVEQTKRVSEWLGDDFYGRR